MGPVFSWVGSSRFRVQCKAAPRLFPLRSRQLAAEPDNKQLLSSRRVVSALDSKTIKKKNRVRRTSEWCIHTWHSDSVGPNQGCYQGSANEYLHCDLPKPMNLNRLASWVPSTMPTFNHALPCLAMPQTLPVS